ncbi:MAG: D-aminoacyl-tRNA deacylase, partial [Chloroflexota bacterium]
MRALIQRVQYSSVIVDQQVIGEIDAGLMILLGVGSDDGDEEIT